MKFVLAGQPNAGKSTIFNSVAGYRSATANFPGSSVTFFISRAMILGREVEVVDLPGIYSMISSQEDAGKAEAYLLEEPYDLIINVVDASRLGRSLELTLQLLELEKPMIVALNMMDEAVRGGMEVDAEVLSQQLGVPVVPTVGRRGSGLKDLFRIALQHAHVGENAVPIALDREVEEAVEQVMSVFEENGVDPGLPGRFVGQKLLERDPHFEGLFYRSRPELKPRVRAVATVLQKAHGWSADQVISGSRHAVAHCIEEEAVTHTRPKLGWRERADHFLLSPYFGGPVMVAILGLLFWIVFKVGQRLEAPLVALTEELQGMLAGAVPPETLLGTVAAGVLTGIAGGVAIVLPYLLPFLIGLAVLEDTGYLPRMAYILDNFMHRLGLHGKSVLPLMLGYGCSVPAIMAARILPTRDRRITAVLASFIPCSARTVVIFGLVAAYMGPWWALFIYFLNLVLVVLLGNILARRMKGAPPGLILEIPELQVPSFKTLVAKTWLTLKEFITIAWPLLVVSSVILGLLEWAHSADAVNALLSPLTVTVLGLPAAVGMTLVFGILRKELTLVMLVQAMGTTHLNMVLTDGQLLTFTLFVVFYVPCVATIAVMAKELGWRDTALVSGFSVVVAVLVGVASRIGYALFT